MPQFALATGQQSHMHVITHWIPATVEICCMAALDHRINLVSHALRTQTCTLQLPTTAVEPLGSPVHPLTASTDTNARAVIVARDRGEVRSITPTCASRSLLEIL